MWRAATRGRAVEIISIIPESPLSSRGEAWLQKRPSDAKLTSSSFRAPQLNWATFSPFYLEDRSRHLSPLGIMQTTSPRMALSHGRVQAMQTAAHQAAILGLSYTLSTQLQIKMVPHINLICDLPLANMC